MRFLIAEDHPIIVVAVGEILEAAFGQGGCETDTVSTGESVLHAVGQAAYCLVLDLDMPGRPRSVPLLAEVKGVAHDIRMAVYTGHAHTCLALAA